MTEPQPTTDTDTDVVDLWRDGESEQPLTMSDVNAALPESKPYPWLDERIDALYAAVDAARIHRDHVIAEHEANPGREVLFVKIGHLSVAVGLYNAKLHDPV